MIDSLQGHILSGISETLHGLLRVEMPEYSRLIGCLNKCAVLVGIYFVEQVWRTFWMLTGKTKEWMTEDETIQLPFWHQLVRLGSIWRRLLMSMIPDTFLYDSVVWPGVLRLGRMGLIFLMNRGADGPYNSSAAWDLEARYDWLLWYSAWVLFWIIKAVDCFYCKDVVDDACYIFLFCEIPIVNAYLIRIYPGSLVNHSGTWACVGKCQQSWNLIIVIEKRVEILKRIFRLRLVAREGVCKILFGSLGSPVVKCKFKI